MTYTIADMANGAKAVVCEDGIAIFTFTGEKAQEKAENAINELKQAYEVQS
jgi:cell division GTPase FtsZ